MVETHLFLADCNMNGYISDTILKLKSSYWKSYLLCEIFIVFICSFVYVYWCM